MNRREVLFGAAAFLLPLVLYLATLCPTVHLGDSGELNLAAATLGIPHVPGYPLFTQIGHLFCRIPLGNGAMRGNLFSAVMGALACYLLFRLILGRFGRPIMAFAFAMALAGSFTLWEQSLKIRAYPLNTCIAIGVIYLTLKWRSTGDRRLLMALGLLFGLGMANHEILLVAAPIPMVAMIAHYRQLRPSAVFAACAFGLLGLSLYAYLPIRAMAQPVLNWGDPSSLDRLIQVLLQQQYAGKMFTSNWGPKLTVIGIILRSFWTEFGLFVPIAGLAGIVVIWRADRVLGIGLLLTILFNIAIRINYIGQQEFHQVMRYMITSLVAFLLFAAYFVDWLVGVLERSNLSRFVSRVATAAALLAVALPGLILHGSINNLARHRVGYDYTMSTLSFPEEGYALAVGGDNDVFPMWYLQRFERYREDVVVLPKQTFRAAWLTKEIAPRLPEGATEERIRYTDLPLDRRFYSTLDRLNKMAFPVYSLFDTTAESGGAAAMQDLAERFGLAPCGMALRFGALPAHCDPASGLWDLYALDLMTRPDLHRDSHTTDLLENVAVMTTRRGLALAGRGELNDAVAVLVKASQVLPEDPWPKMNLANTLARAGHPQAALALYDELIDRDPDNEVYRHNRVIIENTLRDKGVL